MLLASKRKVKVRVMMPGTVRLQEQHLCLREPPPAPQGSPVSERRGYGIRHRKSRDSWGHKALVLPQVLSKGEIKKK